MDDNYVSTSEESLLFEEQSQNEFKIEQLKHKLDLAKLELKCLNEIKVEMQIEIDALNGLQQINGTLESKIRKLEHKLSEKTFECVDLEMELDEERTKRQIMESESAIRIMNLKNALHLENHVQFKAIKQDMGQEFEALQAKNDELMVENKRVCERNEDLMERVVLLETVVEEKNKEILEMKDSLIAQREEFHSIQHLVQELKEEKALLSAELTSVKYIAASTKMKRMNSLFSEVEDKRVSLVSKFEMLQNKYKELKKIIVRKNQELKTLEVMCTFICSFCDWINLV